MDASRTFRWNIGSKRDGQRDRQATDGWRNSVTRTCREGRITRNRNVQRWCRRTAEWLAACRLRTVDDGVLRSVAAVTVWTYRRRRHCHSTVTLYSSLVQQYHCLSQQLQPTSRRQLYASCSLMLPAAETRYPSPPCRCLRRQFDGRTAALNAQQLRPVVKVLLWSRGLTWRSQVGANPIPIPTPLIWRYLGVK